MSKRAKPKKFLSWDEQQQRIAGKMELSSDIKNWLQTRNYYRLSGYWFPMRVLIRKRDGAMSSARELRGETFTSGHNFKEVQAVYSWDSQLRMLLMEGLTEVEVCLRAQVAYALGEMDVFAHRNPDLFVPQFSKKPKLSKTFVYFLKKRRKYLSNYENWLQRVDQAITREQPADDAIAHQLEKYGDVYIWSVVEILEFQPLITAFKEMRGKQRNQVSQFFGYERVTDLISQLEALNNLRNKVAHHARIWNRNFSRSPVIPNPDKYPYFLGIDKGNRSVQKYRLYPLVCIICDLTDRINPNTLWSKKIRKHLQEFPLVKGYSLSSAGFPSDWKSMPHWSDQELIPKP